MSQNATSDSPHGRVTHAAIAARMGISRSAVTEALHRSRKSNLRPELRRQIQEMARQMSYQPRDVTTHTIGVLLSSGQMLNQADTLAFSYLEKAVARQGYRLAMINPEGPSTRLGEFVNHKTVDGVILTWWEGGRYRAALPRDLPCLLMSEEDAPNIDVDQIGFDLAGMLSNLFRHLLGYGHQRICLVAGQPEQGYYERLHNAARLAWSLLEKPEENLILVATTPRQTAAAVLQLMEGANRPTAVICSANYHLFPLYCALFAAGYKIPQDVSVTALVDDVLYLTMDPAVTATDVIGTGMAERVAERLIARIDNPVLPPQREYVAGNIIERASVGPAPNAHK